MDTYENEYIPRKQKKSPYADSPYECVYDQAWTPDVPEIPKEMKAKRRNPLAVLLLVVIVCAVTAVATRFVWEGRMARMENAMNEKFAALEQLYTEKQQNQSAAQLPASGPMTPGQVYAKTVDGVVAIHAVLSGKGYEESVGSGFVISEDGYVVPNYHVVQGSNQVTVLFHNGKEMEAKVIGTDSANDIALLKVEGENLPYVTMGSSDALVVGDQVVAIGNPLGDLTATLTVGYISAKDRIVNTDGTVINMLQTDAAINSGNSGGPLFNMNGEVIGITTAKYSGNSNSGATIEGLGFAIPTDDVVGILADLKVYGYVTGAYLGVYVRDVNASAQSYGLPAGAYIEEAMLGYCAQKAGIRAGDIIVNLGGYDVDSVTVLTRVLRRFKAGETVSVTVYRAGKQEYLTITLDEKPVESQQTVPETTQPETDVDDSFESVFPWFDFFDPFF